MQPRPAGLGGLTACRASFVHCQGRILLFLCCGSLLLTRGGEREAWRRSSGRGHGLLIADTCLSDAEYKHGPGLRFNSGPCHGG